MWLSAVVNEVINAFVPCRCHFCRQKFTPQRATAPWFICPLCLNKLIFSPRHETFAGLSATSFYDYNRLASRLLRLYKYSGHFQLSSFLTQLIIDGAEKHNENIFSCSEMIIPIPSPKKRQQQRGYNHLGLIARRLSRQLTIPYSLAALSVKNTIAQQAGLNYAQRQKNLACAFKANNSIVEGKRIVLLDDVITTGATVTEAGLTLLSAGAREVKVAALFHARRLI